MRLRPTAIAILLLIAARPGPVRGDGDGGVVAVLPPSAEDELSIYSRPVAAALVRDLAEDTPLAVETLDPSGSIPARVAWVVDGRIVRASPEAVTLEARVRDPARGEALEPVAVGPAPLTRIDALARELAGKLAPAIEKAETARNARERTAPARVRPERSGPAAAIVRATRATGIPVPEVNEAVTREASGLARRLGLRPVRGDGDGILGRRGAVEVLEATAAELLIMTDVRELELSFEGVVVARGKVRVAVVDRSLSGIYDQVVATDTVVGSRGDGREAITRALAAQAMAIAEPAIRRARAAEPAR